MTNAQKWVNACIFPPERDMSYNHDCLNDLTCTVH